MSKLPLTPEQKTARLTTFFHELTEYISQNRKFSFILATSKHRITWSANAHGIRGVLLDANIVKAIGNGRYEFTDYSSSLKMKELINITLQKIDGEGNYLSDIINDHTGREVEVTSTIETKVTTSNKHIFPRIDWDLIEGDVVIVECKKCGAQKRSKRSGNQNYFTDKGSITPYAPPCIIFDKGSEPKKEEPKPEPLPIEEPFVPTPQPVKQPVIGRSILNEATRAAIRNGGNSNLEARLHEALVMLNLAYEDMVKSDLYTPSRRMIGGFLYSQGYSELLKQIDK